MDDSGTDGSGTDASGRLVLARSTASYRDRARSYRILIDGAEVGKIKRGEMLGFPVPEGRHTLQLKIDWCTSRAWPFVVASGQTATFGCSPGAGPASMEKITDGASRYIALRPVDDPADLAEFEVTAPSRSTRPLMVVGVCFFVACFAVIGGWIWHTADPGSTAADVLLGAGIGVWCLSALALRLFKKAFGL